MYKNTYMHIHTHDLFVIIYIYFHATAHHLYTCTPRDNINACLLVYTYSVKYHTCNTHIGTYIRTRVYV